jgi:hypothetical protein
MNWQKIKLELWSGVGGAIITMYVCWGQILTGCCPNVT